MCDWFTATETSYWDYHIIIVRVRFIKFIIGLFLGDREP